VPKKVDMHLLKKSIWKELEDENDSRTTKENEDNEKTEDVIVVSESSSSEDKVGIHSFRDCISSLPSYLPSTRLFFIVFLIYFLLFVFSSFFFFSITNVIYKNFLKLVFILPFCVYCILPMKII
jgi:hypothetical protein